MSREQEVKNRIVQEEALRDAYERISPLVWQDLWKEFCGISFDPDPHVTSFKEGRRQVVNYMLLWAGKLNMEEMGGLWQKIQAR